MSSSIYGKVASFTAESEDSAPKRGKDDTKGNPATTPEDVEADLRAEFLNNNDALYDSHERTPTAGFPLETRRNQAEKILDDLPTIDPLREGHQYVSSTVEREFTIANGGQRDGVKGDDDVDDNDGWTPEMIDKLKLKKEEIVQVCYINHMQPACMFITCIPHVHHISL